MQAAGIGHAGANIDHRFAVGKAGGGQQDLGNRRSPDLVPHLDIAVIAREVVDRRHQPARSAERRIGIADRKAAVVRSEEHTSELQSLLRISYAVFCLKQKTKQLSIDTKPQAKRSINTT